jgi:Tol biopolymer transport system component
MAEPTTGTSPSEKEPEDRLDSWKEIAAFLNRDVTTVQRWEKREGMPVHRHLHDRMGSVYAFRSEIENWSQKRKPVSIQEEASGASQLSDGNAVKINKRFGSFALGVSATLVVLLTLAGLWLRKSESFWKNPLDKAHFQSLTEFDGVGESVAVSRDGHFVAFLSDRDGKMDVWLTQIGSGQFHNLTHGGFQEVVNPSIRDLGFSPDGALVTFWARRREGTTDEISVWEVPTLGGETRPYLEGVAEYDWASDGHRLAYHTPGPGDPLFVQDGMLTAKIAPIYTAPTGLHSHFPTWSPDGKFIYLTQGSLPDKFDIWRISATGGNPEQITSHNSRVIYPVFLDARTLLYLATDADGLGPWLYSIDVERRIPHRLTVGLDSYSSLSASSDGSRLVATLTKPKRTLWRVKLSSQASGNSSPEAVAVGTSSGFAPRFGSGMLVYETSNGTGASLWKVANGTSNELWHGDEAQFIGAPSISKDSRIAFSIDRRGERILMTMNADGTSVHVVNASLKLEGSPTWAPDGQSITTAVSEGETPRLYRVPLNGGSPETLVKEYSTDPTWSPDAKFVVYSGPDVGTTFTIRAADAAGEPYRIPPLTLTREGRHLTFVNGREALIVLRGDIKHKNLWRIDLETGAEKQLTDLGPEFDIRDFDISADGSEVIVERVQQRSDVILIDLNKRK